MKRRVQGRDVERKGRSLGFQVIAVWKCTTGNLWASHGVTSSC